MSLNIVMPVYNAENTLAKSLESFVKLSSLIKDNITLTIIDDKSTDSSIKVIQRYVKNYPNINLVRNTKNMGPGFSRNFALTNSKSEYIGFLDADDEICPLEYTICYEDIKTQKADMLIFNGTVEKNGSISEKYDHKILKEDELSLLRKCTKGKLDGSVIFSIFNKTHINKNRLRFGSFFYEDISFQYSSIISSKKLIISDVYAYKKHNRNNSIINTFNEKHIFGMIESLGNYYEFCKKNNFSDYDEFEKDFSYWFYGILASLVKNSNISQQKNKLHKLIVNLLTGTTFLNFINREPQTQKDFVAYNFLIENNLL